MRTSGSVTLVFALGTLFFWLGCDQLHCDSFWFISLCFILSSLVIVFWEPILFNERQKVNGSRAEEKWGGTWRSGRRRKCN